MGSKARLRLKLGVIALVSGSCGGMQFWALPPDLPARDPRADADTEVHDGNTTFLALSGLGRPYGVPGVGLECGRHLKDRQVRLVGSVSDIPDSPPRTAADSMRRAGRRRASKERYNYLIAYNRRIAALTNACAGTGDPAT